MDLMIRFSLHACEPRETKNEIFQMRTTHDQEHPPATAKGQCQVFAQSQPIVVFAIMEAY